MFFIFALALLLFELAYFRVAERYAIVDKPNNRSSHTGIVIRGGGVIFYMAVVLWFLFFEQPLEYFVAGATLLAVIGFMDDLRPQRAVIRFAVHALAVALLFYQTGVYHWPVALVGVAAIVCMGTVNAFNFMDGINGITGIYALVNLGTFMYVQQKVYPFSDLNLMVVVVVSVLIFLFFNFRRRARCFAGDVGSTTLAFIQILLLLQVIVYTQNFFWVIMFLVFGIDSVVTIVYRLRKKQNIFQAHRTHLYQYLSNEAGLPHTTTSLFYGVMQLVLNIILVLCLPQSNVLIPLACAIAFVILYLTVRHKITRKLSMP